MVRVPISDQDGSNFVELSLKFAARGDKQSSLGSVATRLIFRFIGIKESQCIYWPVQIGFLYTDVINPVSCLSTRTSRNGKEELSSFSNTKRDKE